ncbi:hypothetical protein [Janthinobacterium agaricidamnosum]|uniref:Uncharacterized protein n=1 Tax=Janthinobacterium agaricidamnosum NBRC 102515 = DSM 9628 TaxID=1349767 RepID=W0V601_9BURK|nr:hypothetical protein [Janthinobacterium agaricidamnosum]CDG84259.1 hypothetical protein GJA_3644 [Janthinobacterium agaricidamnosum NBRC 102515 = DSM 9628]
MTTPNQGNQQGGQATPDHPPSQASQQQGSLSRAGENFVLVDSEQGLDIGDDQFAIGEVRRADRVPHRQGGSAGQSQQQAGPDTSGSTGV